MLPSPREQQQQQHQQPLLAQQQQKGKLARRSRAPSRATSTDVESPRIVKGVRPAGYVSSGEETISAIQPRRRAETRSLDGPVKLLAYLGTGTGLTLLSQAILNQACTCSAAQLASTHTLTCALVQDLTDHTVQLLALVKFSAMLCGASAAQLLSTAKSAPFSRRTNVLVTLLGVLDVLGYACFTLARVCC